MKKLAPHLSLANHAIASNAWVLDDQNGNRFLIDTGHAGERVSLRYDGGLELVGQEISLPYCSLTATAIMQVMQLGFEKHLIVQ